MTITEHYLKATRNITPSYEEIREDMLKGELRYGSLFLAIPNNCFPSHKILKPYSAHVEYTVNPKTTELNIIGVTFPYDVLDKIEITNSFIEDIRLAAENNAESLL